MLWPGIKQNFNKFLTQSFYLFILFYSALRCCSGKITGLKYTTVYITKNNSLDNSRCILKIVMYAAKYIPGYKFLIWNYNQCLIFLPLWCNCTLRRIFKSQKKKKKLKKYLWFQVIDQNHLSLFFFLFLLFYFSNNTVIEQWHVFSYLRAK